MMDEVPVALALGEADAVIPYGDGSLVELSA